MDLRVPGLAIAVAAVVATSVGAQATRAHRQGATFEGVAHSAQQADARARAMLDRTYLLGAVRVQPPAGYQAAHPHQYEVQDERWLSLVGDPIGVITAITAHPPAGFAVKPTGELAASGEQAATELRPTDQEQSLLHLIDVTAKRTSQGRVVVLVQAIVAWVPPRTTVETISADVRTGELSSGFGDSPDAARLRRQSLSTAQVRSLAAALNAKPTVSAYSGNACPEGNLGLAVLTLPHQGGQAVFQIDIGSCGQVQVQVDGVTQPNLAGGAALSRQIDDLLGTATG